MKRPLAEECCYRWNSRTRVLQRAVSTVEKRGRRYSYCKGKVMHCSDNAESIQATFRMLKSEKPAILFSGCAAHILNLLAADIFKNVSNVTSALKAVDGYI